MEQGFRKPHILTVHSTVDRHGWLRLSWRTRGRLASAYPPKPHFFLQMSGKCCKGLRTLKGDNWREFHGQLMQCHSLSHHLASAYPPKPHFLRGAPGVTCNEFGQSSTVFGYGFHPQALLLRHSPLKPTLASAYPPKPLLFALLCVGA